jgi:hypothetical protein
MMKDLRHLIYYRFNTGVLLERVLVVSSGLRVGEYGCFSCSELCLFSRAGKFVMGVAQSGV